MKNYSIRRYTLEDYAIWNNFVSSAKNATFLFHRDFMEYHSDRFQDFSLLVFDEDNLISILPANRVDDSLFSHQGLTYGGFVFDSKIKLGEVISVTKAVLAFLHSAEITTFQIKLIPSIYNAFFSEEIEYVMFLANAKLIRKDCLSVIDLTKPFEITKTRKESIRRGEKNSLEIREELKFDLFWNEILIPNLNKKHVTKPVHSLTEINDLQQKFPKNIRHFNVYHEDKIVAGTITSSPFLSFPSWIYPLKIKTKASKPLPTPMQWLEPQYSAKLFSNILTSSPRINQPLSKTNFIFC